MNNISVVISAPSGAGKTTVIRRFMSQEDRFAFSVSTTTRQIRAGEKHSDSYYFVSEEEFKELIKEDQFLEWACVHGNYYGTRKKEIDRIKADGKIPIFDVDVQGCRTLQDTISDGVYIFIVPPNLEILEARLRERKTDSEEQIQIRLGNSIRELKQYRLYDYIIVNDEIDRSVDELRSIITAELCRRDRIARRLKNILEDD